MRYWKKFSQEEREAIVEKVTGNKELVTLFDEFMSQTTDVFVLDAVLERMYKTCPGLKDYEAGITDMCICIQSIEQISAEMEILEELSMCDTAHTLLSGELRKLYEALGLPDPADAGVMQIIEDIDILENM